jgi:hypothetical protein
VKSYAVTKCASVQEESWDVLAWEYGEESW